MTTRIVKTLYKISLVVFLFVAVIGYAFLKTKDLTAGAYIKLDEAPPSSTTEALIKFSGFIPREGALNINGRKIQTDQSGSFRDDILLMTGYNVITLEARDKFGKQVEKTYQIMRL